MTVSYIPTEDIKIQADTLRSEYQDGYATDVIGIATQKLGIRIRFMDLQSCYGEGTLGMVLPDEKIILCDRSTEPYGKNKATNEHILRFTIAHEIGHYALHRQFMGDCESPIFHKNLQKHEKRRLETQANMFAAELLMPEESFRRAHRVFTANHRHRNSTEVKQHLSDRFNISKETAGYRMNILHL